MPITLFEGGKVNMMSAVLVLIKCLIILVWIMIAATIVYIYAEKFIKEVYYPIKLKANNNPSFETLITILNLIINSELDAYENDIFRNKGSITNQNFDSYYKDITTKIVESISPDLEENLKYYLTEDAIYRIVGRAVKKYLTEKITGTI